MSDTAYKTKRGELETYFGRTAADKWVALTSNSPVSRIRATVRAGREEMRNTLLHWLPQDLTGARILDAGCGTGMLAIAAAQRGADVVAVDLSPALISEAVDRTPPDMKGSVQYSSGDMSADALGSFDYVVAMDSFIHYPLNNMMGLLETYAPRVASSILFTFAPKTPFLAAMHTTGKLFPRNDRSPAIVPISEQRLRQAIDRSASLDGFGMEQTRRISSAFYKSQAMELKVQ